MRAVIPGLTALALSACNYLPGATPSPSQERVDTFVAVVEGAGCQLHQADNDQLLDPAGFGDAEASAISQQLIAEGRAVITPEGNLVLRTENCL